MLRISVFSRVHVPSVLSFHYDLGGDVMISVFLLLLFIASGQGVGKKV